jgi:hypothetical protein
MKISRFPKWCVNTIFQLSMVEILVIISILSLMAAVAIPAFIERQSELPIGSSVVVKGTSIKGIVSEYKDGNCVEILTVDKNGINMTINQSVLVKQ